METEWFNNALNASHCEWMRNVKHTMLNLPYRAYFWGAYVIFDAKYLKFIPKRLTIFTSAMWVIYESFRDKSNDKPKKTLWGQIIGGDSNNNKSYEAKP